MSELPIGWTKAVLSDLVYVSTGKVDANHASENGSFYFYTCALEPLRANTYSFEGDLIILPGNGANVGHVSFYNGKIEAYQRTYVLSKIEIHPKYLYWQLKENWKKENLDKQFGSATNYLKMGNFTNYIIPLAPLNEQIRIANKLDSLLAKVDAAQSRLEKIPTLLKRFRQSVLAAATSGELTREWRKGKALSINNKEIDFAYLKGWELERLKAFTLKGKNLNSEDWKGRCPLPYQPTDEDKNLFGDFPSSWQFVSLDQITRFVKDGPHFSPDYSEKGIPFISGRNISHDGIDFSSCKYISDELHLELSKRCKPLEGDILYTKGGTTGIACINNLKQEFNVWVHVAVLRVTDAEVIDPNFVKIALNSPKCYERSQHYTHGVANRDLGLKRMIKICFPIPNIIEQNEIVHRVESLFALADVVEKQYKEAKHRIDRITQSLLAKAFRGELVPQDPNDEPAAELLKRIQAERAAQTHVKKSTVKKSARATETQSTMAVE